MSGIALALFAAKSTTEEYSARKPSDNWEESPLHYQ